VKNSNVGYFEPIPAQWKRSIPAEPSFAWDRSGGAYNGRLYIVFTHETVNDSHDTDIYFGYSNDNGASWNPSNFKKLNDDSTIRSQFLPRIAVDQTSGNVVVVWYDCRNDTTPATPDTALYPSNRKTQFFATLSQDGGATFWPNFRVSGTGFSDRLAAYSPTDTTIKFDFGDYPALAFRSGTFFPVWTDNSNSTGDNPPESDGFTYFDIYTRKISLYLGQ